MTAALTWTFEQLRIYPGHPEVEHNLGTMMVSEFFLKNFTVFKMFA